MSYIFRDIRGWIKKVGEHISRRAINCSVVCRMDSGSFWNFGLFIVLKYLLCLFMAEYNWTFALCLCILFPCLTNKDMFLKNHLKCLGIWNSFVSVKECAVCVCSLWTIIEWLNAMYIHGFNFCYRPRNCHPMCSFIVLVVNLNKVRTWFGWYSIIPRQNLPRTGWFLLGFIYVCKTKWHYLKACEYEK